MKHIKNSILGTLCFLSVSAFAQPNWTVNSAGYSSGFSVNAVLNINGNYSANTSDMIAAFDNNGTVRGMSNVVYDSGLGEYMVYLTVLGNTSPDSITFQLYDAGNNIVYTAINDPIIYVPNQLIGEVENPFVVSNINVASSFSISDNSVNENSQLETPIGDLSTMMSNSNDTTFTYSLVSGIGDDDNGSFSVNGNQLVTNEIFDYETKDQYTVRVKSMSGLSVSTEKVFLINIDDVSEFVGVEELSDQITIEAYPNPSNGSFQLTLSGLENVKEQKIEIINLLGKVVDSFYMNSLSAEIHLSVSSGIYFVKSNRATKRIIIK